MDVGTLIVFLAILAAALAFVGWPLAAPALAGEGPSPRELRRGELSEEKERVLRNLTDLEFDHQTGKMDDADFDALSGKLKADAARVLKEIDVNEGRKVRRPGEAAPEPEPQVPAPSPKSDAVAKAPTPQPPPEGKGSTAGSTVASSRFCTKCGWKSKAADDLFCGRCGASLPVD